jgi:indole-3-glycerol phosphate synthase
MAPGNSPNSMSRLEEILQTKRKEIDLLRPHFEELRRRGLLRNDFRSLRSALRRPDEKTAVLAEIKKASPSAGIIAPSFDPVKIALTYEISGADAVSVLTDEQFFDGRIDYLAKVRETISRPILRKDFILDEVQVLQSAAAGADAILLIVAALSQEELLGLRDAASRCQLEALIEVHTLEEVDRALDAGAEIIGINNRDLNTFAVDLSVTEQLSEEVPSGVVLISESGIKTAEDIQRVAACGVDAVLVGEALMRGHLSIETLRPL